MNLKLIEIFTCLKLGLNTYLKTNSNNKIIIFCCFTVWAFSKIKPYSMLNIHFVKHSTSTNNIKQVLARNNYNLR